MDPQAVAFYLLLALLAVLGAVTVFVRARLSRYAARRERDRLARNRVANVRRKNRAKQYGQ